MRITFCLLLTLIVCTSAARKPFPRHWGSPPAIQTQDYIPLPGGYGHGSSTLAHWIQRNLNRDKRTPPVNVPKPFPAHWGSPPRIQTRDYRPLPGGYGRGSSTLARWIQGNLDRDARAAKKAAPKPLFVSDFSQEKPGGELSEKFMVLNGEFAVKTEGNQQFLELPGNPVHAFGVLFGPTESHNVAVKARILGANQKRRLPAFGIGLNGVGGYRLQVSGGKEKLELYRQDEVVAFVPYKWLPGRWHWMTLQVRKLAGDVWRVEGKVWVEGRANPAGWMITYDDKEEPYAGKASIWGLPYSGQPTRFDDLSVTPVGRLK